ALGDNEGRLFSDSSPENGSSFYIRGPGLAIVSGFVRRWVTARHCTIIPHRGCHSGGSHLQFVPFRARK
ncbi:MAG: hypothetical protein NZ653_09335, partial [Anaerolineae bacterium]|nr:hypothetical protein [Anaerolineae bacterium]